MTLAKRLFTSLLKSAAIYFGSALLLGSLWTIITFGPVTIEQFLYHLFLGPTLLLGPNPVIIILGTVAWVMAPLALTGVFLNFSHKRSNRQKQAPNLLIPLAAVGAGVLTAGFVFDAAGFAERQSYSSLVDEYYVAPQVLEKGSGKKNLILIYVESLESTYSNEVVMGSNLIPQIEQTTQHWVRPERFDQLAGVSYTMAGIVASQCGIPLLPRIWLDTTQPTGKQNLNKENYEAFLPRAVCLGDVLQKTGYTNVFLGGARKTFANKGRFFSDHGYGSVFGWEDWEILGEASSEWGLYDDRLLSFARSELRNLASNSEPFNLTILTLDTHHPTGLKSETCRKASVSTLAGIVKCTDSQVADFVEFVQSQEFENETVLVVTGDHLAMKGELQDKLSGASRQIFFAISVPGKVSHPKMERPMNHFDIFPTVLDALGLEPVRGKAGLGESILEPSTGQHFSELPEFESELQSRSRLLEGFWQ